METCSSSGSNSAAGTDHFVTCRVCLSSVQPKHSISLFTPNSISLRWPMRLSELLLVDVASGDGLPNHMCRTCRDQVVSVEKKLQHLRCMAGESYEQLQNRRKRVNDASSVEVSPELRPQHKRQPLGKKTDLSVCALQYDRS